MPTEKFYSLKCINCEKEFDESETVTNCLKCGAPLDIIYDYELIKRRLNNFALENAPISAMKYLDFYPIMDLKKIVTLKEGGTPLYKIETIGKELKLNTQKTNKLFIKHFYSRQFPPFKKFKHCSTAG